MVSSSLLSEAGKVKTIAKANIPTHAVPSAQSRRPETLHWVGTPLFLLSHARLDLLPAVFDCCRLRSLSFVATFQLRVRNLVQLNIAANCDTVDAHT